jgi:hypothetical protein
MTSQFCQAEGVSWSRVGQRTLVVITDHLGSTCGSLPSLFPTANQELCPRAGKSETSSTTLSGPADVIVCADVQDV